MIAEVMKFCNNYFVRSSETLTLSFDSATKTISSTIDFVEKYIPGQYINITNSFLNDTVYKIASVTSNTIVVVEELLDEATVECKLEGLAPSKDFLSIATKIKADVDSDKYSDVSEIKRGDTTIKYGDKAKSSWEEDYKKSLAPYIKVRVV